MQASTAGMTSDSNSIIAIYQSIGSYTKTESPSKRNGSFENENCFLGSEESLEIKGKIEHKKHKKQNTDLKHTMKSFVT